MLVAELRVNCRVWFLRFFAPPAIKEMEEKEERLTLSVSIKKSLPLVSDKSIGIRAETYNLGALLLIWWKVCFMICHCFHLREGNDIAKEMWKAFF